MCSIHRAETQTAPQLIETYSLPPWTSYFMEKLFAQGTQFCFVQGTQFLFLQTFQSPPLPLLEVIYNTTTLLLL
jgi:hypothetical protein